MKTIEQIKEVNWSPVTRINDVIIRKNKRNYDDGDILYFIDFPYGTAEIKLSIEDQENNIQMFSLYIDSVLNDSGKEVLINKSWNGGKEDVSYKEAMIELLEQLFNYNIIETLMKVQPHFTYNLRTKLSKENK